MDKIFCSDYYKNWIRGTRAEIIRETRNKNGMLHSFGDEPCLVVHEKSNDGTVVYINEMWGDNGVVHRVGGPALISIIESDDGFEKMQDILSIYVKKGKFHREDGPFKTGKSVIHPRYYVKGLCFEKENFPKALRKFVSEEAAIMFMLSNQ